MRTSSFPLGVGPVRPRIIEWIWQPGAALRFREQDGKMLLEQLFHGTAYDQATRHEWRPVPTVSQGEAEQWRGPVVEVTQTNAD